MHIIHVAEQMDLAYGGPAHSIPQLACSLQNRGLSIEILSVYFDRPARNEGCESSLQWIQFPGSLSKRLRYSKKLEAYLKASKQRTAGTIFHVHNLWNAVPWHVYRVAKHLKIPYVVSTRGMLKKAAVKQGLLRKALAWLLFNKQMLSRAACIHVTEEEEAKVLEQAGINTAIVKIPNGIVFDDFSNRPSRAQALDSLGLGRDHRYLLFLSRILPHKGLDLLVSAWHAISEQFPNWHLIIAGASYDDAYYNSVKAQIATNDLGKRVHDFGLVEGTRKLDILSASDLLVLPSKSESFGMSIAESLACGVPVITTTGTPWQVLNEKQAGWWIPREHDSFVRALTQAFELTDEKRKAMGLVGQSCIKAFDWSELSGRYEQLYRSISTQ